MKLRALLLLVLASAVGWAAPAWHQSLYLGNDGVWQQRFPIVLSNQGGRDLAGESVELRIGSAAGEAPLAGLLADGLRLCTENGTEFLWAINGPDGKPVRRGPVPAGSSLFVPAECPAGGETTLYLYADNPTAWAVPDFFPAARGLRNGGLEEGSGDVPAEWHHEANDDAHRTFWVSENPQAGKRCLKTVVADGAEETWIATRQRDIQIQGGATYRLRAWVKAEKVKGNAGWYIHVGNAQNFMLISPMLNGGGGSYDWKELTVEFSAPADANVADLGTVLRGTGTAWFDEVSLTQVDGAAVKVTARVLPAERIPLAREVGADAPWPSGAEDQGWDYRFPVRVLNLTEQALESGFLAVDLAGAAARLNRRTDAASVRVMDGDRLLEAQRLGDLVLCRQRIEPRTRQTLYVYFRVGAPSVTTSGQIGARQYAANPALPGGETREAISGMARGEYMRLLESPLNRVRNPSFEQGEALPEGWVGSAEGQQPAGTRMESAPPGLFGQRGARLVIPADSQPAWTGWRQDVPVQPERTYLYAAWLKCADLVGSLQLHAHYRNAQGELCQDRPHTGAGPAISGTTDWTLISGVFSMPPDCATFQLHLTMLATGTAEHDGVLLTEVMPARLGALETRLAATVSGPVAWPVNAVVKVFRDDTPPAVVPSARLTAARHEREPLQVALRSPQALGQVTVEVEAPVSATGARLTDITMGVVGYVPIDNKTNYYNSKSPAWQRKFPVGGSASDGWPGWWPDPILPRQSFDLAANSTQPVWVTVAVPKEAVPGDYSGKIRFSAAGKPVAELPFTVHVWDFTLPDEMHLKAIYDCRQNSAVWQVPGQSAAETRREFWRFMAEHRLCPDTIRPEPSIRYQDGQVIADFAAFDQAAAYYFDELKLPHAYTPWLFYGFGWGHPPAERFGQAPYEGKSPYEGVDRRVLRPEFKQAYQACLKVYWEHLKAKGWERQCVLYISDEPFDGKAQIREQMKALCEMIHEVDPAIPIYSSTWHHQPEWDGYLNIWGIGHYGVVPVEKLAQLKQDGARIWWTTDGQMCTDTPYCAVERLLPHYCFKYGAEAYEFWGIDWLTYDPYEFGWHSYIQQSSQPGESSFVRYPNGDGFLAYPGSPIGHPGPVTSVRLEQAREGCEDYEYLYLLRQRIAAVKATGRDTTAAEKALAEAQELVSIPNAGGRFSTRVLPDPDAVLAVKERLAGALEALR
jgi:acetone carboxylase gamma subunit